MSEASPGHDHPGGCRRLRHATASDALATADKMARLSSFNSLSHCARYCAEGHEHAGWIYGGISNSTGRPFYIAPKDSGVMQWQEAVDFAARCLLRAPERYWFWVRLAMMPSRPAFCASLKYRLPCSGRCSL